MALISPKIGLITVMIIYLLYAIMMIFLPSKLMEQYGIDMEKWDKGDNLFSLGMYQLLGINYLIAGGVNGITMRIGSDNTKSTVCFMNAVYAFIAAILCAVSYSFWVNTIGVESKGIWFNVVLFALICIVNALGSDCPPTIKMSPLKNPLYWGFILAIVVYGLYMIFMFANPVGLLNGYGVNDKWESLTFNSGILRYAFGTYYIHLILLLVAQLITDDSIVAYVLARFLWGIMTALMIASAIYAVIWSTIDDKAAPKYDHLAKGSYFNAVLYVVFTFLFYGPVARLDSEIKYAVADNLGKEIVDEEEEEDDEDYEDES
jgi:hypothetical protein